MTNNYGNPGSRGRSRQSSFPLSSWQLFSLILAALLAVTALLWHWRRFTPANYSAGHYSAGSYAAGRRDPSAAAATAGDGPHLDNCPVFPADNVWNTPVDRLPKHKLSDTWIDSIGPAKKLHPDFGVDPRSGIPYTVVPPGTPGAKIEFEYADDSDLANYPIPGDALIEGGNDGRGDRHILLVDEQRCLLYEIFAAVPKGASSWKAGSGIRMDLTSNSLREEGKTSADAAGLPILPGLVRYDEVAAGEIRHALRFTLSQTQAAYLWPARHYASKNKSASLTPMGARFRLRASFDVSHYSKSNQVILTALKRYGMFMADNGSSMFVSGVSDQRWDDDDLHHLGDLRADDFEAVDESELMLLPNSGRVDPKAVPR